MQLGKQLRNYRTQRAMSQEELAQRVYVSRQTISSWENGKSYPDLNSIVLLSEVFHTSIDQLLKGDVEIMKQAIQKEDRIQFEKLSLLYSLLLGGVMVSPIPLIHFFDIVGMLIWVVLAGGTLYVAFLVEKQKTRFDIHSYREIVAFLEGASLDELEKEREKAKRPYQKVLLAFGSGAITLMIAIAIGFLLHLW